MSLLYEYADMFLVIQVGELIGGSQREERYDVIQSRYVMLLISHF